MDALTHRQLANALYEAASTPGAHASVRLAYPTNHRCEEVVIPVADLVSMLRAWDRGNNGFEGDAGSRRPAPIQPLSPRHPPPASVLWGDAY